MSKLLFNSEERMMLRFYPETLTGALLNLKLAGLIFERVIYRESKIQWALYKLFPPKKSLVQLGVRKDKHE